MTTRAPCGSLSSCWIEPQPQPSPAGHLGGVVEIKALAAKVRQLEADKAILKAATIFSTGELDSATVDHGVQRHLRSEGHAVESVCAALREQGARSRRGPTGPGGTVRPARTIGDAQVIDAVATVAWTVDDDGRLTLTSEGLYGRRR